MLTLRKRWRLRALMGLIVLAGLGMAFLREWPDLGPVYRLKFADPAGRKAAAVQLGKRGPRTGNLAEPALLAALSDPDQEVRDCAAWALNEYGSTSPALVKALARQVEDETSESVSWRWRGVDYQGVEPSRALKRIRPSASTLAPLLRNAMSSPNNYIRMQAATLLREAIHWSGGPTPDLAPILLATLQDGASGVRAVFIDDLAKSDDATRRAAVAVLLQRLRSLGPPYALEAVVALAQFGREAEPAAGILADRLQGGDLGDRLRALFLLGRLGPAARPAVPAILRAITASDAGESKPDFLSPFWRQTRIGHLHDEGVALDPKDEPHTRESLRHYGLFVLGRIGREAERQGIGLFIEMMGAGPIEARRTALETLAKLGPKASSAIPALIEMAEGLDAVPARPDDSKLADLIFRAIRDIGKGDDPLLVAALVRMLASRDRDQRARAASALQNLSPTPKGVVPALLVASKDSHPVVRRFACDALGRYLGPEGEAAVPALLTALGDPDPWVRIYAGQSLAGRGEAAAEAIPALVRLLRDEDRNPRREAARVLGKFGPAARVALGALLVALDDEKDYVRKSAEDALNAVSPIESQTAGEAIEALGAGEIPRRLAAACDLVRPGSAAEEEIAAEARVEALRKALGDPDPVVRATAAAALGRLGPQAEGVVPALLAAMKDARPEVRALAATALARVAPGHEEAIRTLGLALTGDPDVDVRGAAASGLGRMGPPAEAAAPVMLRALDDRDAMVRVHVIVALGRIGPAGGSVATALKAIAERDPSVEFRIWAIRALSLIGGKSDIVVPTLVKLLDDPSEEVRDTAAYQLGEVRPARAVVPALLGLLNDGRPPRRSLAVYAMGMLGPEGASEALPGLIRALRDTDDGVRKEALDALMELKEAAAPAAPAVRQALNDHSAAIRSAAELALKCIAGTTTVGSFDLREW